MNIEQAKKFLEETAKYFDSRDTKGEDRAHWANVYNAENCRKIIALLEEQEIRPFYKLVAEEVAKEIVSKTFESIPNGVWGSMLGLESKKK